MPTNCLTCGRQGKHAQVSECIDALVQLTTELRKQVPKQRRHYPWALWLREPFQTWEARPGEHFDTDKGSDGWATFYQILKSKAYTTNRLVELEGPRPKENPGTLDYVVRFQFYERDDPRPRLQHVLVPGVPFITCDVCGRAESRVGRLAEITECLIHNPHNPADPYMYYAHRNDSTEPSGYRRVTQ